MGTMLGCRSVHVPCTCKWSTGRDKPLTRLLKREQLVLEIMKASAARGLLDAGYEAPRRRSLFSFFAAAAVGGLALFLLLTSSFMLLRHSMDIAGAPASLDSSIDNFQKADTRQCDLYCREWIYDTNSPISTTLVGGVYKPRGSPIRQTGFLIGLFLGLVYLTIYDPMGPLYTNTTCPIITREQNCRRNGRPDRDYENWRWKPEECDLPRLDPRKFSRKLSSLEIQLPGIRFTLCSALCGRFQKLKSKSKRQDCLHWCLPGPIDTWNDILLETIRREFEGA